MHLQRIQVPDFRVLKDVDITFEKDFSPRIFPLGSQNGGGKSTLLQLVFTLLHCPTHADRLTFLKNILRGFKIKENEDKRVLAIMDIWDGEKTVSISFSAYKDSFIGKSLHLNNKDENFDYSHFNFSALPKLEMIQNRIVELRKLISTMEEIDGSLCDIKEIGDRERRDIKFKRLISENDSIMDIITNEVGLKRSGMRFGYRDALSIGELQKKLLKKREDLKLELLELEQEKNSLSLILDEILKYLKANNLLYITNYSAENNEENEALLCHISNFDIVQISSFLDELSQKIFLAAPSTQVFLFLSQGDKKLLFKEEQGKFQKDNYFLSLKNAKSELPGLFTYDFLAVGLLIKVFESARNHDFNEAVKTGGEYGNNYKILLNELKSILTNKILNPTEDLSGVVFKADKNGVTIELEPEDLSHGELKRLCIYMWLRYGNIKDAIVLMDEIEIAFHPDWQYQIISDLEEWTPNNQYIIATHSYHVCEALTPRHVKELEPKLLTTPSLD